MKVAELFEAPIVGDSYFSAAFMRDETAEIVRWFRNNVDTNKFDLIVGTGLSGALMVPLLARATKKRFVIVRKGESTHSTSAIEGYAEFQDRWIFVDDFMETGSTRKRVQALIDQELNKGRHQLSLKYVGDVWYMHQVMDTNLKKGPPEPPKRIRVRRKP